MRFQPYAHTKINVNRSSVVFPLVSLYSSHKKEAKRVSSVFFGRALCARAAVIKIRVDCVIENDWLTRPALNLWSPRGPPGAQSEVVFFINVQSKQCRARWSDSKAAQSLKSARWVLVLMRATATPARRPFIAPRDDEGARRRRIMHHLVLWCLLSFAARSLD